MRLGQLSNLGKFALWYFFSFKFLLCFFLMKSDSLEPLYKVAFSFLFISKCFHPWVFPFTLRTAWSYWVGQKNRFKVKLQKKHLKPHHRTGQKGNPVAKAAMDWMTRCHGDRTNGRCWDTPGDQTTPWGWGHFSHCTNTQHSLGALQMWVGILLLPFMLPWASHSGFISLISSPVKWK